MKWEEHQHGTGKHVTHAPAPMILAHLGHLCGLESTGVHFHLCGICLLSIYLRCSLGLSVSFKKQDFSVEIHIIEKKDSAIS